MSLIERSNKSVARDEFTTPKKAHSAQVQGRDDQGRVVDALGSEKIIDIPSPYSSSLSSVPETPVTPLGQRTAVVVQTDASDPEQSPATSSPVLYIPHEEEEEDTPVAGGGGDHKVTPEDDGVVRRLDLGNADQDEASANSVAVDGEPLETPASRRKEKVLSLFEALEKARGHFPIDDELVELYEELHKHALSMRKLNQYNYKGNDIKLFNVVEAYRRDKRIKVTYELKYTDEAKKALANESVAGEVFSRRFSDIQGKLNELIEKAKKKIYNLKDIYEASQESPSKEEKPAPRSSPMRVKVEKSPETGKGSGLDEAFKTSETEYFFYCTAGLVAGKAWRSVIRGGQEITWLDLQRDARVPTKKSIRMDGKAHIGALYSQLSISSEGKTKFAGQLTKGDRPYHNNRQEQITKSSTPLKALYRAYRFMKKALINRSTYAKGGVFAALGGAQKTYNTRSTAAPEASKVSKGVFTVDGKNLVDKGTRLEQVNVLVISLRRAINGVLRAIKNERDYDKEDANSVLSIGANDTNDSVFSDPEFLDLEDRHYPKNEQVSDKQKALPKRSKDDMDSNSNVKKK